MSHTNGAVAVWGGLPVARNSEEFGIAIRRIKLFEAEWKFKLGQWLSENLEKLGPEIFWQWVDELGKPHPVISNLMWVANQIGDQYTPEIPWTWWQSMAAIPADERDPIISRALGKTISRDEIRALGHRNGSAGLKTQMATIPSELDTLEDSLAVAYVTVGRLVQRRERTKLTLDALDELIDAAMALRGKLIDKIERA